jgi:hypothetical protein
MKTSLLISIILFVFVQTLSGSALGDLAAGMKAGEWAELSTNGLSTDLLRKYNKSIFEYAAKGQWDPVLNKFFFLGSGHERPFQFLIYDGATNTWSEGPLPLSCMHNPLSSGGCGVHSYYYATIDVPGRQFLTFGPSQKIYAWNIDQKTWSTISSNGLPSYNALYGGLSWFPETNCFFYNGGDNGLWRFSKTSSSWSKVGNYKQGPYHNFSWYSKVHETVLFGGGNGSSNVYKIDNTGKISPMASAPSVVRVLNNILVPEPVTGDYLLYDIEGSFHIFGVAANRWSSLSSPPISFTSAAANYGHAIAAPVYNHGVVMWVTNSPAKVFLYKHKKMTTSNDHAAYPVPGSLRISPTPFRTATTGMLPGVKWISNLSIFNSAGQSIVQLSDIPGNQYTWCPKNAPNGVYFIQMRSGKQTYTKKVLLQK